MAADSVPRNASQGEVCAIAAGRSKIMGEAGRGRVTFQNGATAPAGALTRRATNGNGKWQRSLKTNLKPHLRPGFRVPAGLRY
jgi:hypothetical protein